MKLRIKNNKKGFTLIEIIVSVSIFTVVMLITMGALLTLNDSSRKAQAVRTVIDNLNFSLEYMNKKIRTGDSYHCFDTVGDVISPIPKGSRDCPNRGGDAILIQTKEMTDTNQPLWIVLMFYVDPSTKKGGLYLRSGTKNLSGQIVLFDEDKQAITSPEVDIKRAKFRVIGSESLKKNPAVIVNITGVVDLAKKKLRTDFSLQTVISQRLLE